MRSLIVSHLFVRLFFFFPFLFFRILGAALICVPIYSKDIPDVSVEELGMKVANETTNWQNGKCLVFDDSFLHEGRFGRHSRVRYRFFFFFFFRFSVLVSISVWFRNLIFLFDCSFW
jgi:hypothetical protein